LPELRPEQLVYLEGSELQSFPALAQQSGSSARLAILTPYEYFGYFRKVHPMSRRLHLVRERIYTQQLAFYVRRHSHLVGVLNKQIQHAHTHGFLEHWTRQYVSAVDEKDESVARIASWRTDGCHKGFPVDWYCSLGCLPPWSLGVATSRECISC